jgi:hypothetical protein
MKKLLLIAFFVGFILNINSTEASTSFQVKKTTDLSYSTTLNSVTN